MRNEKRFTFFFPLSLVWANSGALPDPMPLFSGSAHRGFVESALVIGYTIVDSLVSFWYNGRAPCIVSEQNRIVLGSSRIRSRIPKVVLDRRTRRALRRSNVQFAIATTCFAGRRRPSVVARSSSGRQPNGTRSNGGSYSEQGPRPVRTRPGGVIRSGGWP